MTNPLRPPLGTTSSITARVLLDGEMAYNTTTERLHVGDNATYGGRVLAPFGGSGAVSWFNVKDSTYGALGDDSNDDSAEIQLAIDAAETAGAGVVYLPKGTYQCKNLTVPGSVTLLGDGAGTVMKLPSSAAITDKILRNETTASYTDSKIALVDITFDGNNVGSGGSQTRFTGIVELTRVTDLTVRGCTFKNIQSLGLALGGCKYFKITECTFEDIGYQGASANRGPALFVSESSSDSSQFGVISLNVFKANFWHAMSVNGYRMSVIGNTIDDCDECGIFMPHNGTTIFNVDAAVCGNVIFNIREHDISGSGMELGGRNLSVTGNTVTQCDHNGISLTDVQNASVTGNTIRNINLDSGASTPQGAGIAIVTTLGSGSQPQDIVVSGNRVEDDQGTVTAYSGIAVGGAGTAALNVRITDTALGGFTYVGGSAIVTTKFGLGCVAKNNDGARDTQDGVNKLHNGSFAVNQRAAASNADDTYGPDRWYILTQSNAVAYSILTNPETGVANGVRITQSNAGAQRMGIAQIIENRDTQSLVSSVLTLAGRVRLSSSADVRYAVLEWTGTANAVTSDVVNDWTSSTYTAGNFFVATTTNVLAVGEVACTANTWRDLTQMLATVGASANNLIVFVWTEGTAAQNVTLDLNRVQMERGWAASDYQANLFEEDVSVAQRFYEKSFVYATVPAQNVGINTGEAVFPIAVAGAVQNYGTRVHFQTRKRGTPTVTLFNPAAANAEVRNEVAGADSTTSTVVGATDTGFRVSFVQDAGAVASHIGGVHWTADAEL